MLSLRRAEAPQQRIDRQRHGASTVISPRVSKPRKSTSITLTTLVPPPSGKARLEEERGDVVRRLARQHRVGQQRHAAADQRSTAAGRAGGGCAPCAALLGSGETSSIRFGSQRRPSRISTVVTTSTTSWVSARSGAENQTKVMQVTRPHDAEHGQRRQAVVLGLPGGAEGAGNRQQPQEHEHDRARDLGRSPQCRLLCSIGISPASTAASTSRNSCGLQAPGADQRAPCVGPGASSPPGCARTGACR